MTQPFAPGMRITPTRLTTGLGVALRRLVQGLAQSFPDNTSVSQVTNWVSNSGDGLNASGMTLTSSRLVISEPGIYVARCSVGWETGNQAGRRVTALVVNATIVAIQVYAPTGVPAYPCNAILRLSSGDEVEVQAAANDGANLLTNLSTDRTRFELVKIAS